MNAILHILLKDLRRIWIALLVWIGMQLLLVAFGWHVLNAEAGGAGIVAEVVINTGIGMVLVVLIGFLFAAGLIREDSPGDSSSFWITRPISGLQLLTSKLAGIVLYLWLPMLFVSFVWWRLCGLSAGKMLSSGTQVLTLMAGVTLLALGCAPFLKQKSSLLASLATVLVVLIGGASVMVGLFASHIVTATGPSKPPFLYASGAIAVGIIASLVYLYLLRHRFAAMLCVFGGMAVAIAMVATGYPRQDLEDSKALSRIQLTGLHFEMKPFGNPRVAGELGPIPGNCAVRYAGLIEPWVPEGDPRFPFHNVSLPDPEAGKIKEAVALRHRLLPRNCALRIDLPKASGALSFEEKLRTNQPQELPVPAYASAVHATLYETVAMRDIPLTEGIRAKSPVGTLTIESVSIDGRNVIAVDMQRVTPQWSTPVVYFFLADRKTDRVCEATGSKLKMAVGLLGVSSQRLQLTFDLQKLHPESFASVQDREDYVAELKIVQLVEKPWGSALRPINLDAATLTAPPLEESQREHLLRSQERLRQKAAEAAATKQGS